MTETQEQQTTSQSPTSPLFQPLLEQGGLVGARWFEWGALAVIMLVAAYTRFHDYDVGFFSCHFTRDLYRSQGITSGLDIPFWGSELQYGGRTFGPFCYFLYAIPLIFRNSVVDVALFAALFNWLCILAAWWFTRRWFNAGTALLMASFYAVFPLEISQIRFLWNPVFFPGLILVYFTGIYMLVVGRNAWGLAVSLAGFFMAFNVHFSAIDQLPILLCALFWKRQFKFERKPMIAAAIILIIGLTPPIGGALFAEDCNLSKALSAEAESRQENRWTLNPYAIRCFVRHLHMELDEPPNEVGFRHLGVMRAWMEEYHQPEPSWISPIERFNTVQLLFWALGFITAFAVGFRMKWLLRLLHYDDEQKARAYLLLIPWQLLPLLILSFFNLQAISGKGYSMVSLRYFLVIYPANFITIGLGVMVALNWMEKRRMRELQLILLVLLLSLWAGQIKISRFYIWLTRESGKIIPYTYGAFVPNLREGVAIADSLIDEFKIHPEDYFHKVHSPNVFTMNYGETNLDWLMTQQPRAYDNPRMPSRRFVVLYIDGLKDPEIDPDWIVMRKKHKDINLVMYDVPEDQPLPSIDTSNMRNRYYSSPENRMRLREPFWK